MRKSSEISAGTAHALDPISTESVRQVNELSVESCIAEKRIGERIKHLRLKRSMGLMELGRHTGLSASFLSQLETGRVVPTLRNLARIAMVFSRDLSYFFDSEPRTLFRIHRMKDRVRHPQTGTDDPAYFFESLGYLVPDRQLDPYLAEFLPGKQGRAQPHQHAGSEFLYVVSGALDMQYAAVKYHLETGDAAYFDASTIHSYACAGETPSGVLIVTLQQPVILTNGQKRPTRLNQTQATKPTSSSFVPQNGNTKRRVSQTTQSVTTNL